MPANEVIINGALNYEIGDSKMPPLMMYLDRYCYGNLPEDGVKLDTIFAAFLKAWAKSHYGDDFTFDTCVVKLDIEPGVHIVAWSKEPMDGGEFDDS